MLQNFLGNNLKKTRLDVQDKVPLYAGSRVYVSKADLLRIFIPQPLEYTSRLTELVFGLETLETIAINKAGIKDRLKLLDDNLLNSIISKKF